RHGQSRRIDRSRHQKGILAARGMVRVRGLRISRPARWVRRAERSVPLGAGGGFPSRDIVRGTAGVNGVVPSKDTITITGASLVGDDGSIAPLVSNTQNLTRATVGVTFQARKGFFVGGGVSWNVPQQARDLHFTNEDEFGDYFDWQV